MPSRPLSKHVLALCCLLALMLAPSVSRAVELRDAALVAAGGATLESAGGALRLEAPRLGPASPPVFVPEPGALWQLAAGSGLLMLLERRRRGRARASRRPANEASL